MNSKFRFPYYAHPLFRTFANVFCWILYPERRSHTGHLITYLEEGSYGPLQREEAYFLSSLVRMIRPETIVEFGFHIGHSAFNFLQALQPGGQLYSFDTSDASVRIAETYFKNYPNLHLLHKSQSAFLASDVDGRSIDLVFIDGAHELEINLATFYAFESSLAPNAIIAVHDTGTWFTPFLLKPHVKFLERQPNTLLSQAEFQHQPDERTFVNEIVSRKPEFQIIHFHSKSCLRHGISLLQKKIILKTQP